MILSRLFAFLCLAVSTASSAFADGANPSTSEPRKPVLFLIGDSTVKNSTAGLQGWGTPIAAWFDREKISVENHALGGRSSRSYLREGLWDAMVAKLHPGDFVLMQFGHNDGGPLDDAKARASLKGGGEETKEVTLQTGAAEVVHTYGWYLRKYVSDAKAKGATPIVCSLIPRNIWINGKVGRSTNDYGKWAAEAAAAEGVAFLDLNRIIADHYDPLGAATVMEKYFTAADHTHTTPPGAEFNAACVVEGLKAMKDCPLAKYALDRPAEAK